MVYRLIAIYVKSKSYRHCYSTASNNTQPTTTSKAVPHTCTISKTYTVVSGDTLIKIANQHGISLGELKVVESIDSHIDLPWSSI